MLRAADFRDAIARPLEAASVVNGAAALDAAVDVFGVHVTAGDTPVKRV
jgi:hypothetical protein